MERAEKAVIKAVSIDRKEWVAKEEFENKITGVLEATGAELVVLAGFMRILSPEFVGHWHHKIVNIHPALLPSFPGLDGQGQALNYGVKIAGCTVHFVDEGTDSGPIILQKAVPVLEDDDLTTLKLRVLTDAEWKLLPEAVKRFCAGKIRLHGGRAQLLE